MADTEYPRAFRCARCRRMRFWVIAQSLEHEREIAGPVAVAVEAMLAGYRPGWSDADAAKRRPPEGLNPALKERS